MGEALLHASGSRGELMLLAYCIGGLAVFGAAFLPGNTPLYRVVCLVLGAAMTAWAAKVMLLGGVVYVNALVLLAPLALLLRGGAGTVRFAVTRPARPAPRPHPAARQFGGPGSYQPHPPTAYATVHAAYPAAPSTTHPHAAAAATHAAYPATAATMHPHAAATHAHAAAAYATVHAAYPAAPHAVEPVYARAAFATEPVYASPLADPRFAQPMRPGAHAAQPAGHVPRRSGSRGLETVDPSPGSARHRASGSGQKAV